MKASGFYFEQFAEASVGALVMAAESKDPTALVDADLSCSQSSGLHDTYRKVFNEEFGRLYAPQAEQIGAALQLQRDAISRLNLNED